MKEKDVRADVLSNPQVLTGFGYCDSDVFRNPDAVYAFWANDYVVTPTGPIHYGRETARAYRDAENTRAGYPKVWLMEDFDRVHHLPSLDSVSTVDAELADAIFATTSYSYAKSIAPRGAEASVTIASVRGAHPSSVFREIELDEIMNNKKITHIHSISRFNPDGKLLPKREAYHALRDEWVVSSIEKFGAKDPNYNKALQNLAEEIVLAERNKAKSYPFSRGDVSKERADTLFTKYDRDKEENRLKRLAAVRRDNPALERRVQEMLREPESLTYKQSVIAKLERAAPARARVVSPEERAAVEARRHREEERILALQEAFVSSLRVGGSATPAGGRVAPDPTPVEGRAAAGAGRAGGGIA